MRTRSVPEPRDPICDIAAHAHSVQFAVGYASPSSDGRVALCPSARALTILDSGGNPLLRLTLRPVALPIPITVNVGSGPDALTYHVTSYDVETPNEYEQAQVEGKLFPDSAASPTPPTNGNGAHKPRRAGYTRAPHGKPMTASLKVRRYFREMVRAYEHGNKIFLFEFCRDARIGVDTVFRVGRGIHRKDSPLTMGALSHARVLEQIQRREANASDITDELLRQMSGLANEKG